MKKLQLTNDQKRKDFIRNYQEWPLVRLDKFNDFSYYRYTFEDGSFFTALEHKTIYGPPIKVAIITLTSKGRNYVPIASTQSELVSHLKEVAK